MNHISFGSVLKEARISKGYELNAVSRRLRIRPDILEAVSYTHLATAEQSAELAEVMRQVGVLK